MAKHPAAPGAAYAPVLNAGFQATTRRVQEMHHAIADKTFDVLQRVPIVAAPAQLVRTVHDAITDGVYATLRQAGGALVSVAAHAERLGVDSSRPLQGKELALRSALNAIAGDALREQGSTLALTMGFHAGGQPLPLSAAALAGLGQQVCVFIHGLGCDERSWLRPASEAIDYGRELKHEQDIDAIYLRYNTGLPVAANGKQLGARLAQLLRAAPQVRELLLIGHSMGGLVARSACDQAAAAGQAWLERVGMLICLGTPHQGAALEKLGHAMNGALAVSDLTRPLARIASRRSQGIKDLRHGLRAPMRPMPPLRFVAGGSDRLVGVHSASDAGLSGDVQRVRLAGLGHMALLNHPRVYAVIRAWLAAPRA
ncbi:MAG TPA: alpha/beta fold hydrolase [Burkholderiaceae bacterium]|jgi:pimeloyl-ACP methyl ester carboxylesterase|nr:alpha/beta fold hydrolase [Burkholderiaceae bacterium]